MALAAPLRALVIAIALNGAAPALAQQAAALPAGIASVVWEWESFTTSAVQIAVNDTARYTLQLEDGRAAVRADCNRGMGSFTLAADGQIAFSEFATTRALCPPESLSNQFLRIVSHATSAEIRDGELYLELPSGAGTLRFRRQ